MWIGPIIIFDQIIKYIVEKTNAHIKIIEDVFNVDYAQNTGAMYGFFKGNNHLFAITSLLIIILLSIYVFKNKEKNNTKFLMWQFVIAGGISNVIDRFFRGYVVDFIQLRFFKIFDFGIFNLSDACIVLGIICIIFIELKEMIIERKAKK